MWRHLLKSTVARDEVTEVEGGYQLNLNISEVNKHINSEAAACSIEFIVFARPGNISFAFSNFVSMFDLKIFNSTSHVIYLSVCRELLISATLHFLNRKRNFPSICQKLME